MWLLYEEYLQNHSNLNSLIVKSRLWSHIYFDLKSGSTNNYLDDFMKVI